MLQLKNISLRRGLKVLLDNADLTLYQHEKVGLVGSNGVGKTSLFKMIKGNIEPDKGDFELPNGIEIAEIAQEVPHGSQSALDYVLTGDSTLAAVFSKLKQAEEKDDGEAIAEAHLQLSECDGYTAESRAAKLLVGLGFAANEIKNAIDDFSGGWRMRLNLARVLMQPSDLLLLDEPTNHLDLEAIFWLESWLRDLKTTIIIISHDREFLDNVVQKIVFINEQKLHAFTGNYSDFERLYAQQLELQQASFTKQQKKVAHLQSFVDRFRAKASKAKQAQSRLKMIERMDKVAAVQTRNPFSFEFKEAPEAGNPMLTLRHADIGYNQNIVLNQVSLSIHPGDRIALVGPNGAGKSTLVKALAQILPVQGESAFNTKLKIGYFTQYQIESLTFSESAMWHLQMLDSKINEREARQFLGGFNFQDDRVFEPIQHFSGGEKARLALALLVWQQPNILLLDEPSNHLDLEMREALANALQFYQGALILITHDRFLLTSLADELYLIANNEVQAFIGDVNDYQKWYSDQIKQTGGKAKAKKSNHRKKTEDEITLQRLETKLERQIEQIKTQEAKLTDPELYQNADSTNQINQLQSELQNMQKEQKQLENDVLALMETLGD